MAIVADYTHCPLTLRTRRAHAVGQFLQKMKVEFLGNDALLFRNFDDSAPHS